MRILTLTFVLSLLTFGRLAAQSLMIVPKPSTEAKMTGGTYAADWSRLTLKVDRRFDATVLQNAHQCVAQLMHYQASQAAPTLRQPKLRIVYCDTIRPEAYRLAIGAAGAAKDITIYASEGAGAFYGMATLQQIAEQYQAHDTCALPRLEIYDAPRFGWRGFMLDEGRHFFGKEEVKRILKIMARYKMNRFHWHLTEDQGWRIAIEGYPRLTEVGAWRISRTLPWGGVPADTLHYGGFYTADDIREIVNFARQLHIEIVPEIDMPGHFQAAIASYPEILACDPDQPHQVWVGQGVSTDVMNVANEKAIQFTKHLIDQLIDLFPFRYIHLGGDECPTQKWQQTPACQALLKQLGSKNYTDLQTHFYKQISDYLAQKPKAQQRDLIFWNEVLYGNTSKLPHITIMAWVGADQAAQEAARRGFNTILTPQIPYYINRKQSTDPNEPHTQGPGHENLRAVYAYEPAKNVPADLLPKYLGVQANFWSEWVEDAQLLEYLLLPRLAAVAEAGWTPQTLRHYPDFLQRIASHRPYFRLHGYLYGQEAFRHMQQR